MRTACARVMVELVAEYPDLVTLGADARSIFVEVAERCPRRFVDVGIAEANLVGVASGLARSGKRVFVGAIGAFLIRRAYEQIRNDVCNPGLDVTFVGIGGGFSYGTLGPTHHLTEDFAIFRALPHTTVLSPADAYDAAWAIRVAVQTPGPVYVRLGAGEDPIAHRGSEALELGRPVLLRPGGELLILATGRCVAEALLAADELSRRSIHAGVANVNCIKPLDHEVLADLARGRRGVLVAEEHSKVGGLGSVVLDALAGRFSGPIARLAVDDRYAPVGTREALLRYFAIDCEAIVAAAEALLRA